MQKGRIGIFRTTKQVILKTKDGQKVGKTPFEPLKTQKRQKEMNKI